MPPLQNISRTFQDFNVHVKAVSEWGAMNMQMSSTHTRCVSQINVWNSIKVHNKFSGRMEERSHGPAAELSLPGEDTILNRFEPVSQTQPLQQQTADSRELSDPARNHVKKYRLLWHACLYFQTNVWNSVTFYNQFICKTELFMVKFVKQLS